MESMSLRWEGCTSPADSRCSKCWFSIKGSEGLDWGLLYVLYVLYVMWGYKENSVVVSIDLLLIY